MSMYMSIVYLLLQVLIHQVNTSVEYTSVGGKVVDQKHIVLQKGRDSRKSVGNQNFIKTDKNKHYSVYNIDTLLLSLSNLSISYTELLIS